jgi:hypothetical protein
MKQPDAYPVFDFVLSPERDKIVTIATGHSSLQKTSDNS